MVNIFLCDDNPLQLRCVHDFIESYTQSKQPCVFDYSSPKELLSGLTERSADIAVLDISLGKESGIDLAKAINARCPGCQVIFLTAYPEYTSEAYFADHAWFILKKDMTKYLAPALDKCLDTLEKGFCEAPAIWVKKRRNRERVPVSEVLYLERMGHQTKVVRLHDTLLCRQSPADLLSALKAHTFIRCHQSFWVNASKIFSLVGDTFHLIDGSEILISRTYKKEATQLFEEAVPAEVKHTVRSKRPWTRKSSAPRGVCLMCASIQFAFSQPAPFSPNGLPHALLIGVCIEGQQPQ